MEGERGGALQGWRTVEGTRKRDIAPRPGHFRRWEPSSWLGKRAKKVGIQLRECAVCSTWTLSERSKTERLED